jgi:hypothetical protein
VKQASVSSADHGGDAEGVLDDLGGAVSVVAGDGLCQKIAHDTPH